MDNNETQADIIADMRRHIQAARDFPQDIDITIGDVEDWADRLEAAAKRERAHQEALRINECIVSREEEADDWRKRTGNAAALREALEGVLSALADVGFHPFVYGDPLAEAVIKARSALAATPRTCDLFSSYAEAENYWHENVECAEVNGCFDVWLFSPAEGKEANNGKS